jgi:hypothetical protein
MLSHSLRIWKLEVSFYRKVTCISSFGFVRVKMQMLNQVGEFCRSSRLVFKGRNQANAAGAVVKYLPERMIVSNSNLMLIVGP